MTHQQLIDFWAVQIEHFQKLDQPVLSMAARQFHMQLCDMDTSELLLKWWDFMDVDCTSYRNEYSEEEQKELLKRFHLSIND